MWIKNQFLKSKFVYFGHLLLKHANLLIMVNNTNIFLLHHYMYIPSQNLGLQVISGSGCLEHHLTQLPQSWLTCMTLQDYSGNLSVFDLGADDTIG